MNTHSGAGDDRTDPSLNAVMSERRQLINLSYRLLGSLADAEDVVQETYARWYAMSAQQQEAIESPGGWLMTVASRICLDMHTKDAAAAGESAVRLNLVACWREATVFTDAERAALELTEQGTRIADAAGGVTDEAWTAAAKHYDEDQLTALVSLIALINAFNRLNVIVQQPAGNYQPGQFG